MRQLSTWRTSKSQGRVMALFLVCASDLMVVHRFVQDEDEAPEDAVMQSSLQDHVLVQTYKNLPWLK